MDVLHISKAQNKNPTWHIHQLLNVLRAPIPKLLSEVPYVVLFFCSHVSVPKRFHPSALFIIIYFCIMVAGCSGLDYLWAVNPAVTTVFVCLVILDLRESCFHLCRKARVEFHQRSNGS
jgi:hypothetical protein